MTMNRRTFMASSGASLIVSGQAFACEETAYGKEHWQQCDPVPENQFRRGTITKKADCVVRFELPPEVVQAITRTYGDPTGAPGTYDWILRIITFNRDGSPRWQEAHKVANVPYKEQGIYFGTTMAVYVTCDDFAGWWSSGPIRACVGTVVPHRVNWSFDWKQLEKMTS